MKQTSAAGMVVVSSSGLIEDADDVICELLGYAREEIVGQHGADLIPPAARPRTAVSLDRMRRGEVTKRSGILQRKDGTTVDVEIACSVLPHGRLVLEMRPRTTT